MSNDSRDEENMKPLTWDELAELYDANVGGRRARTLPMEQVFDWAERQTDKFEVAEDGTIRLRLHAR